MKSSALCAALTVLLPVMAAAVDSVVVFNELQYHPVPGDAGGEWIELHNQMAIDIDLSAWRIEAGVSYVFPEGTVIAGGGYLVVAANPAGLQVAAGLTGVLGPLTGSLANAGERVELRDRNGRLMDRLDYRDGGEWPVEADGAGTTLAKREPGTTSGEPEHWTSGVVLGGTPGARNFPDTSTTIRPLVPINALWRYDAGGTDRGTAWKEPGFDDGAWAGLNSAAMVSYWPFNGNATAVRGTNGTPIGVATPGADRNGTAAGALVFNGTSQYISVVGGGGLNGAASGTIAMWARWNGSSQDADCCGTFGAITARQNNGVFSDTILALNGANPATARLVWRQSGGAAPILLTSTAAVGNVWRHVAVTFSPGGSTLYVDGVAQATATGSPMNNGSAAPLSLGAWGGDGTGFMNGSLDDVAVWDQPLTAAQIAALAAGTKGPLDFANSESAVYFSGDGKLATSDELRKTALAGTPVTSYFRRAFDLTDLPARTSLKLDLAVDDGAVVYLNGTEVYRHNLASGPVGFGTLASAVVGDAPLLSGIEIPSGALVAGRNVLAVEVHQAAEVDSGMVFGAGLTGMVKPAGLAANVPNDLVINEVTAAGVPLRIELMNRGAGVVETAGYALVRTGSGEDLRYELPSQAIPAGGMVVVEAAAHGFPGLAGDRVFLIRESAGTVADAVVVESRGRARFPDGRGEFLTPTAFTPGAANVVALQTAVVINEIMYNGPPVLERAAAGGNPAVPFSKSVEQWIELHNREAAPVAIGGWELDGGVRYQIPAGTVIPAGGYLVVARDPAALAVKFPGLAALGPFEGSLSGSGEEVVLRDGVGNPADEVHYYDDGAWPEAADAGGSSLELRDPRSDNNAGGSWAASDERSRSGWKTYSYTGVAAPSQVGPDTQWREFVLGLMDKGEVLLDDISVVETPGATQVELLQNGGFGTDASKWRIIGNHAGTVVDDPDQVGNKVLRLVSTGSTDHMSNHAETTFGSSRSVVNGRTYRISYRAKWISGCRQLNTRLYFNRLARTTVLDGPGVQIGTPGSVNSRRVANAGPAFVGLRHEPAVPAAFGTVAVTVRAGDPDGVGGVVLWSRVDGGAWASQAMDPVEGDAGNYRAVLAGRAAGTVVQFYVAAVDGAGETAVYPAGGVDSRAMYKVNDGLAATNGLHNMRLVTLKADADWMHTTINLMSNQRIGATLVVDEKEVIYDVGLRLKGSEHSRTTSARLGFNLGFDSEHLFRGVHRSLAIDRSESTGFGQREMLAHQMLNHAGGVPTKYHDLCQVMAPRLEHTGSAELQLARYTDVFLDDQYENGSDGMVFEYELVYQLNSTDNGTPEGNKVPAPDSVVGTTIRNMGDDKEQYRWTYLIKNNEDRDDYSRVMAWAKWMGTAGTAFTSQIPAFLEPEQWLRGHAVNVLTGAGDSYGGDGSQHNVQFYVRPADGRMLYFPHDMDAFYDANRTIYPNADLNKILAVPGYARLYFSQLLEILETTYNTAYMRRWADHFGRLLPAQPFASHLAFVGQRATVVRNGVNAAVSPNTPFAISTNGGADTTVATGMLNLTGTANLSVRTIQVNGVHYPLTWTSRTVWSVAVPLQTGANLLRVQGIDRLGNALVAAVDTITVTNTGLPGNQPVRINEWMADNRGPGGFADPADGLYQDWIELFNPNGDSVDLSGYLLSDDAAVPGKWVVPAGTVIPARGFLMIWADGEIGQNTPGNGLHTGFQLSSAGEFLGLYNAAGVAQHTLVFGQQQENVSQGWFPDGNVGVPAYAMRNATPRWPNTLAGPLEVTGFGRSGLVSTLSFTSLPGRSYRVEITDGVGPWTALVPDVAAVGEVSSATDTTADGRRFYRVRRLE